MLHSPNIMGEGAEPSPLRLRALSLGAGVQSTTLALMASHGEIGPMPDCAIFADTGWEPQAVYDHLAPSSAYCATHDYAAYLTEAEASPVRIVAYRILNIAGIRDNEDRQAWPGVEKFARVEVDLEFRYVDTGETAQVNFDFTFLKEKIISIG